MGVQSPSTLPTVKTYASRVGIARVLGETISTCTSTILNFGNGKF